MTKITNEVELKAYIEEHGSVSRLTSDADLTNADLTNADLWYADLTDTNLRDANLQDANLRDANLQDADLRDANLRNANLRDADLWYANLRDANLQDADLRSANLQDADLRNANLTNASLDNVKMSWLSHNLISERLRQLDSDAKRRALAGYIGLNTDWCFEKLIAGAKEVFIPETLNWAIKLMLSWRKEGDNFPVELLDFAKELEIEIEDV